ncbi:MAG: peptidase S41, partial [Lactiplantibacillus plantarum]
MITNKCRYGLVGLISIVLTFGLSASNRLRASFNAMPAITYMSKYGIINHRTQWQAMLHATDHGRKITSLTQLNQILRAANLHSFAVANLRQVEHA